MNLVAQLTELVGPDRVRTHLLDLLIYTKGSGVSLGGAAVVALWGSTDEVAETMRITAAAVMAMVTGGAEPDSLAGRSVYPVPCSSYSLASTRFGPDVVNLELFNTLDQRGLHVAPDPASRKSATVGGDIGTNAGDPRCLAE